MNTAAIVLAAGFSKRLGRPKQLLLFKGEPLVRHATKVALGAGCSTTIVVGPYANLVNDLGVTTIDNPNADEGVASSIRVATEHARGARLLFTLCDQPLVTSDHLRALLAVESPIVATAYSGIVGVPAAFMPDFADELAKLRGERGARAIVEAHIPEVIAIPFADASVDLDTADDVRLLGI